MPGTDFLLESWHCRSDRSCQLIVTCRNLGPSARDLVEVSRFPMMYLRAALPHRKLFASWQSQSPYTLQSFRDSIPSMSLFTTSTSFIYHKSMSCHGILRSARPKSSPVLLSPSPLRRWKILTSVGAAFAFSHLRSPSQSRDGPH
jgi:hypothetical protein